MQIKISPLLLIWLLAAAGLSLSTAWTATAGRLPDTLQALTPWMGEALAIGAAALLHEFGHLAAAWGMGVRVRTLRLDLLGARLELFGLTSYGGEAAVAAGGPAVNLLSAAVAYPLWRTAGGGEGELSLFLAASLGLGVLNLLPVGDLDGGRLLRCGVSILLGERIAAGVLAATTGVCVLGLWLLSVYGLLRAGELLSLFTFCMLLLLRLAAGRNGAPSSPSSPP